MTFVDAGEDGFLLLGGDDKLDYQGFSGQEAGRFVAEKLVDQKITYEFQRVFQNTAFPFQLVLSKLVSLATLDLTTKHDGCDDEEEEDGIVIEGEPLVRFNNAAQSREAKRGKGQELPPPE